MERGLETDCGWFTFVLLWHVPYMQDLRRSSAERLISATTNVRSLEHSLMWKYSCDIMSTGHTCPQEWSHASLMCAAHPPLEFIFVVNCTKEPSVEAGSVRRFSDFKGLFYSPSGRHWCQFCLCQHLGFFCRLWETRWKSIKWAGFNLIYSACKNC